MSMHSLSTRVVEMKIDKVLVGVDFSAHSGAALQHALSICKQTGAELVVAHAFRTANLGYVSSMSPEHVSQELVREVRADSRTRLEALRERHAGAGVRLSAVQLERQPDYALAAAAQEVGADLIVVGTHGRTGLRRTVLGSVAERTVRLCKTSVMVARHAEIERGYRRILVPTDFSSDSDAALNSALGLIASDGKIDLLHCWRLPSALSSAWLPARHEGSIDPLRVDIAEKVRHLGNQLLRDCPEPGPEVEFHQREGTPVAGILERLEGGAYDLVVMGSHGRRGLRRWLLGSVAEATVRHANCSVLVTHATGDNYELESDSPGEPNGK